MGVVSRWRRKASWTARTVTWAAPRERRSIPWAKSNPHAARTGEPVNEWLTLLTVAGRAVRHGRCEHGPRRSRIRRPRSRENRANRVDRRVGGTRASPGGADGAGRGGTERSGGRCLLVRQGGGGLDRRTSGPAAPPAGAPLSPTGQPSAGWLGTVAGQLAARRAPDCGLRSASGFLADRPPGPGSGRGADGARARAVLTGDVPRAHAGRRARRPRLPSGPGADVD